LLNNVVGPYKFAAVFVAILAYFPFVGFVPNMDLQPLFYVSALLFLSLFFLKLKVDLYFIVLLSMSLFSITLQFVFWEENADFKYFVTYLMTLFAIFFFYVCLKDSGHVFLSSSVILTSFFVYTSVGAVQLFYPDFLASAVTRSVDATFSYAETGRGVRSLTGEPSSLGKMFSLLNALYVLHLVWHKKVVKPSKLLVISFSFLLMSTLISRSAYAVIVHFFLIMILWFLISRKSFFVFSVIGSVILFSAFAAVLSFLDELRDIRIANIIWLLINEPQAILSQGAMRRVLNVPITFNNLAHFGWAGAGNSQEVFFASLWTPLGRLDYLGHSRNIGGFVEFALRFGIFSVPAFILYFWLLIRSLNVRSSFSGTDIRIGWYFGAAILLLSFQDSSPALPLALLLIVGAARVNNDILNKSFQRI